jgi:hypothetical protein
LGEGRTNFQGEIVGVSLSLLAGSICLVRDLYIFCCIIKIHKQEERVFPHWVFPGVIYPKIFVSLMVVIVVIFFIVDQIYFSAVHLKFCEET